MESKIQIAKNTLRDLAITIGDALLPFLTRALDALRPFIDKIGRELPQLLEDKVIPAIDAVIVFLGQLFSGGFKTDDLIPPEIVAGFESIGEAIGNLVAAFKEHWPAMKEAAAEFVDWAKENLGPIVGGALETIADILEEVAVFWQEHGDEVIAIVETALEVLGVIFGGALELIRGIVETGLALLRGDWDGALEAMKTSLENFFNLALSLVDTELMEFNSIWRNNLDLARIIIITFLENMAQNFTNTLNEIAETLKTALLEMIESIREKIQAFNSAGDDLIAGLWEGIKGRISRLMKDLREKLRAVTNLVRAIFRIRSPSAVFAEIGQDLMAGLAQGISKGISGPVSAVAGAAPRIIGAVAPSGGAGMLAGGGNFTFVYSPQVSLGDRAEVERVIAPLIAKFVREQIAVRAN